MAKLPFTHLFSGRSHDPAIERAGVPKALMPIPISKIFFTAPGSEATRALDRTARIAAEGPEAMAAA